MAKAMNRRIARLGPELDKEQPDDDESHRYQTAEECVGADAHSISQMKP